MSLLAGTRGKGAILVVLVSGSSKTFTTGKRKIGKNNVVRDHHVWRVQDIRTF
jgi:hypothetical protein